MDYREVWDEANFKFSSDTRLLNHVSWTNYKRQKRQNKFLGIIKSDYEEILLLLSVTFILCITVSILN